MKTSAWALLAGAMMMGNLGTAWAADGMKPAAAMDGRATMAGPAMGERNMDDQMPMAKRKKMAHGGKAMTKRAMKPADMPMKPSQKM